MKVFFTLLVACLCGGMALSSVAIAQETMAIAQEKAEQPPQEEQKKAEIKPFANDAELVALRMGRRSKPIEVASIFYKKARKEPDFKRWTEQVPYYQDAMEIDKEQVFAQVYNKLQGIYRNYKADRIINVQSHVDLSEYSALQSVQVINEFTEDVFFRFNAYEEYFAVIPHGLNKFHHILLPEHRRNEMIKKNQGYKKFVVEVLLRVSQVDDSSPEEFEEGVDYWLMLADIAEIRFWTTNEKKPELVWRYKADWFDVTVDPELMGLFSGEQ